MNELTLFLFIACIGLFSLARKLIDTNRAAHQQMMELNHRIERLESEQFWQKENEPQPATLPSGCGSMVWLFLGVLFFLLLASIR